MTNIPGYDPLKTQKPQSEQTKQLPAKRDPTPKSTRDLGKVREWMESQVKEVIEKKGIWADQYDEIAGRFGLQRMPVGRMDDKDLAKLLDALCKFERKGK